MSRGIALLLAVALALFAFAAGCGISSSRPEPAAASPPRLPIAIDAGNGDPSYVSVEASAIRLFGRGMREIRDSIDLKRQYARPGGRRFSRSPVA